LILVIILLAAAAVRLYSLANGLWHDEILTYVNYATLPLAEIVSTYRDQNQHFLYTLLAHLSLTLFGDGAWSLRFPAAVFGVASVWALYLFGRQVTTGRESLLAAALLAFSYHHIWFSQNARGYIGLLFWTLLASGLLLRGTKEGKTRIWCSYAAAIALGTYTNTAMIFVIGGHFCIYVYQLIRERNDVVPLRWSGLLFGFCFGGALILLLHALVLPQMLGGVVGEESTVETWKHPLWAAVEFVNAINVGFGGAVIAVAALAVFGIGLWSFARTRAVVIALLFIPAVMCAAAVIGMGHHVWPRLFFFSFGFAALVAIRGTMLSAVMMTKLLRMPMATRMPVGTAASVALVLASALAIPRAYAPKQDFAAALEFVEAAKQPGDIVATVGLATFTFKHFYRRPWDEVNTLEELNSLRAHAGRTWLIFTFPTHVAAVYPEIMATIRKDSEIIKQFPGTVGDGTIFVSRFSPFRS
jgi:4-amino-4-deoxy-L-arabinose transferase-like glycosyltransferase